MPKQTIEVSLDVPEGWEATGEYRSIEFGESYICWPGVAGAWGHSYPSTTEVFILRRKEPVRESRWVNVYRETSYETLEKSNVGSGSHRQGVIRLDYENNKLVAVTLEPQ